MTQHLGTRAAIGWASTSDTLSERVHLLAVPLRETRAGHSQAVYRAQSLDRTVIESLVVGSGAHELVADVRYDDDPESLVALLRAGAANVTLNYYPDVRDALAVIPCKLIAPTAESLETAMDPQRGMRGNGMVTLRLRRTDQAAFALPFQGRDILWWYRGGGSLSGYTFTRADTATTWSADGSVTNVVSGQARTIWPPNGNGAYGLPALLLEGAGTNLVLQSEDFGTTWTTSGTPTRSAAAKTCGSVVLDLLGDDDGATQEYYTQTITFTGNAAKVVSFFYFPGTSLAAGGSAVVLRDTTAGADRLNAVITSDGSNRTPNVTCSAGSLIGAYRLKGGVWRICCLTSAVTAANTNALRAIPAATANQQGNVYLGGMQAENSLIVSSYMPTTTATNTRVTDALSRTLATLPLGTGNETTPGTLSVYVRFVEAGTVQTASARVWQLGGSSPVLYVDSSGTYYRATVTDNAGSGVTATLAAAPAYGQVVELLVTADASTGTVTITQSIAGGAESSASGTLSVSFLATLWGTSSFYLNQGPSGNQGWLWLLNGVAARGSRGMAEMRRLAKV